MNNSLKNPNEAGMLLELRELGLKNPSIQKLHYSKKPLTLSVVNVILKWLPGIYIDHVGAGEHLIRALVFTEGDFKPKTIIELYEKSNYNETLKWTMAYVLSISRVGDVSKYIREQLFHATPSFGSSGFIHAIEVNANFKDREEVVNCIKSVFDKYSNSDEHIRKLFRKYGRLDDIPFLEKRMVDGDKKRNKEIEKIISGIKTRKREPIFPKKNKFIC